MTASSDSVVPDGMNQREVAAGLPPTVNYRYADHVDGELFVAGQVPHNSDGELLGPSDPALQTTTCLNNLRALMDLHGFSIDELRHLTVYVVGDREALRSSWVAVQAWFGNDVPPATLLGVSLLGHDGQLVEVDARIRR